ncbi:MAG: hypothetical protein CSA62_12480 [Planctomycetota bacterium]|nr:MAG: hypothetical protein CSA62_12480 [Planctomycetota bacterium]
MSALLWISSPLVGAAIGYVTNTLAVTMLFRPHEPKRFLFFTAHGLIPKRQGDLAKKIGELVGQHLVGHEDLIRAFDAIDLEAALGRLLDKALEQKLGELRAMPLIGSFLSPERIGGLRDGLVKAVLEHREELLAEIEKALEEKLDVSSVVQQKVQEFSTRELEAMILSVARSELRAIEIWGAILGAVIGLLQAVLATTLLA